MKTRHVPLLLLAGLALSGSVLAEEAEIAVTTAPAIDPQAMQALDRMGAYLRGLETFSLRADDAIDEVLDSGQKIQLTKTVELQVRKPDRLRADITTDRKAREIFYDGKHFTLLAPEARYFTTVEAPPSIREMIAAVETRYGIEFPLVDLFQWGEDADAAADIQEAMLVGVSKIDGQMADHYAFRQDEIDWQIWIAQGEAPLPLRYVITTKDEPGEPQYMANLTWDTQAKPADAVFTFTPTKDDHPIAIVVQDETPATQEDAPK
ncbi:DUF2092 domain-containing protein [Thiocystis minor]|uniref:DUF2092 domain-containing protein n=1 Tax=Thiocystis minor TaxID=61597 RepID=UPI001F5DE09C|nr:DUF2092 domain-containing protein [Thiocystis minor]